jgi:hypothetical protein
MPNGPPSPVPAWLAPVVQITTSLGVPTVFAGILLYFVLFRLDSALKVIESSEEDRVKIIVTMQETLVATLERQTLAFEKALRDNAETNRRFLEELPRRRPEVPR